MKKIIYLIIVLLILLLIIDGKNVSDQTTQKAEKDNIVLSKFYNGEFNGIDGVDPLKMNEKELKTVLEASPIDFSITIPFQKLIVNPEKNKYFIGLFIKKENNTKDLVWLNNLINYSSENLKYVKGLKQPTIILYKKHKYYYFSEIQVPEDFQFEEQCIAKK